MTSAGGKRLPTPWGGFPWMMFMHAADGGTMYPSGTPGARTVFISSDSTDLFLSAEETDDIESKEEAKFFRSGAAKVARALGFLEARRTGCNEVFFCRKGLPSEPPLAAVTGRIYERGKGFLQVYLAPEVAAAEESALIAALSKELAAGAASPLVARVPHCRDEKVPLAFHHDNYVVELFATRGVRLQKGDEADVDSWGALKPSTRFSLRARPKKRLRRKTNLEVGRGLWTYRNDDFELAPSIELIELLETWQGKGLGRRFHEAMQAHVLAPLGPLGATRGGLAVCAWSIVTDEGHGFFEKLGFAPEWPECPRKRMRCGWYEEASGGCSGDDDEEGGGE